MRSCAVLRRQQARWRGPRKTSTAMYSGERLSHHTPHTTPHSWSLMITAMLPDAFAVLVACLRQADLMSVGVCHDSCARLASRVAVSQPVHLAAWMQAAECTLFTPKYAHAPCAYSTPAGCLSCPEVVKLSLHPGILPQSRGLKYAHHRSRAHHRSAGPTSSSSSTST
jgi:hypothetical protein